MENKKQSSVDWLMQEIAVKYGTFQAIAFYHEFNEILQQAKAMHRSEIEDAYDRKVINEKQNWFIRNGKHYYDLHYGEQNSSASIENNI